MALTFSPENIDFQVIAGSPAAQKEAQSIIAEIQAAQRDNTIEATASLADRQAFDAGKGGLQIVGLDARSQAILKQEGMYKDTGVSDKLEMGAHTARLNIENATNNIALTGGLPTRSTTGSGMSV